MLDSSTNSPPPPSPVNLSSPTAPKTEPPSDPVGGGGGHSRSLEELSRHLPRFTPVPSGRTGLFSESQQCTGLRRGLALCHASSPQVCARQQKALALQGPPRPFLRASAGGDARGRPRALPSGCLGPGPALQAWPCPLHRRTPSSTRRASQQRRHSEPTPFEGPLGRLPF